MNEARRDSVRACGVLQDCYEERRFWSHDPFWWPVQEVAVACPGGFDGLSEGF